jgi:hypothetical protein
MPIKFNSLPIVWITFKNRVTDEDLLLRKAFSKFMSENNIFPAVRAGGGGPHYQSAGYLAEDADKIIAWFKEHGGEVDPDLRM